MERKRDIIDRFFQRGVRVAVTKEQYEKILSSLHVVETIREVDEINRDSERTTPEKSVEMFWEGFKLSAEGYNYEYWGEGSIEELEKEIKEKAITQPNNPK